VSDDSKPVVEPLTKYQKIACPDRTPSRRNVKPDYEHILEIVAGFLALELKPERKK
jgi:hypothetical protein